MANLSALLNATLSITDTTLTPNATIVTRNLNNPTYSATELGYWPFFQIGTTSTGFSLPSLEAYVVYIKNLATSANILLAWTPDGGSAVNVCVIAPGGVFIYFMPTQTAGTPISGISNGITSLSLTASAAATSADVLLAS